MTFKKLYLLAYNVFITILIYALIINATTEEEVLRVFLISLFFVAIHLLLRIKFFSLSFFFVVFYIMLFYIQPSYYYLTDFSFGYDIRVIKKLGVLCLVGMHLFLLGNSIITFKKQTEIAIVIPMDRIDKAVKFVLIIALLSVALLFADAKTLNILSMSRLELKNSGSSIRLVATFGLYISSILFFLIAFTSKNRSKWNVLVWVIFLVMFEILVFLFFRTRSHMVVHLSSVLVGFYYSNYYSSYLGQINNLKNYSKKFIAMLLAIIIFILAISTRFLRGYLQPGSNIENFDFDIKLFLYESVSSGDLGYAGTVAKIINWVPSTYNYLDGQSYLRLIFIGIPRSLWPDKPRNTETIVGGWVDPTLVGYSVPPGVNGDLYLNFGIYGILLMILFGLIFGLLDKKITIRSFLIWAVSSTWIYHLVRGGFTNPIVIFLVLWLTIYFISKKYLYNNAKYDINSMINGEEGLSRKYE